VLIQRAPVIAAGQSHMAGRPLAAMEDHLHAGGRDEGIDAFADQRILQIVGDHLGAEGPSA